MAGMAAILPPDQLGMYNAEGRYVIVELGSGLPSSQTLRLLAMPHALPIACGRQ